MSTVDFFPSTKIVSFSFAAPQESSLLSRGYYVQAPRTAEAICHLGGQLGEYLHLPENWNGYHARRVPKAVIDNAISALDEIGAIGDPAMVPNVSPQPQGVIAFRWRSGSGEAYLEIGETRFSGYIELADRDVYYLQGDARESKLAALLIVYERLFSPGATSSYHTIQVATSAYPALDSSVSLSGGNSGWGSYRAGSVLSVYDQGQQQNQIRDL